MSYQYHVLTNVAFYRTHNTQNLLNTLVA